MCTFLAPLNCLFLLAEALRGAVSPHTCTRGAVAPFSSGCDRGEMVPR